MIDVHEYIKLPKEERQAHLKLETPCIMRGGGSPNFKGLLADRLDTTLPSDRYVLLCHACHVSGCSNWQHLYWGTFRENSLDYVSSPTFKGGKGRPRTIRTKEQVELVLKDLQEFKWGWVRIASSRLGVRPITLHRLIKKHEIPVIYPSKGRPK